MIVLAPRSARPAGNVPKGSFYGLAALGMLPGVIPFLIIQSLVPFMKNGIDFWLDSIWPVLGASGVAGTIMAAGIARRQSWYIWFIFGLGSLLVAAYIIGLGLGVVLLLGFVPGKMPDLGFINIVNIIDWLVISPLAWLLLRTLRLHYWQPWSTPDQWEPPAPTPPTRTLLMTWANRKR